MTPGADIRYNLTVKDLHTYIVGQDQWVVHNSGTCDGSSLFNRGAKSTQDLHSDLPDHLTENPDVIGGGRSGGSRPKTGLPNSFQRTTGGHVLVFDDGGYRMRLTRYRGQGEESDE